jgi:hypothetical protein
MARTGDEPVPAGAEGQRLFEPLRIGVSMPRRLRACRSGAQQL